MKKFNYNQKIGIIGYGEIGSSLEAVYRDHTNLIYIKDLDRDDGLKGVDILNICIPYSENFVEIVSDYIRDISPNLTVIHSTIVPGTTIKIIENTNIKSIVHSPVRGVHPNLYDGIRTFIKFIGAECEETALAAKDHFNSMSIETELCENSLVTELGKTLSTTYYGLCIAWHGEAQKLCEKYNVPFGEVMTRFNKTYNDGYYALGKKNVLRPVLYPPSDKIGGHCVIPNAFLVKQLFDSLALDLILKYSGDAEKHEK
tara:strand:+ start:8893 stop:9663 length:771 start_codon:yes stop_codon:yes gene_type:complete